MKKLIYLLPLLALTAGCLKTQPDTSSNNYPLGTFTGQFTRLRKNPQTSKVDTLRANLQLVLSTTTGYAVTGDTATVHAGSYGGFQENALNISFADVTYPTTGVPAKTHLAGIYDYAYDGVRFQITGTNGDSIAYLYDLKKVQ
jgi:hypothetical protein